MSHSKTTPYFPLPQFEQTDTPAWIADINPAFEEIDADLYEAIESAKSASDNAAQALATAGDARASAEAANAKAVEAETTATEAKESADGAHDLFNQFWFELSQLSYEVQDIRIIAEAASKGTLNRSALSYTGDKIVSATTPTQVFTPEMVYNKHVVQIKSLRFYTNGEIQPGEIASPIAGANMFTIAQTTSLTSLTKLAEYDSTKPNTYYTFTQDNADYILLSKNGYILICLITRESTLNISANAPKAINITIAER